MATIDTAQRMLEEAQKAFRQNLRDPYLYAQILTAKTVTVVYDAIAKLQETMAPNGLLRGLGRLKPLLDRLSEFSFSIEALLSPSSSLLALIWGPIKAILTHSRRDIHVFSKNIDMLAMIGDALPPFGEVFQRFTTDGGLREILALFYQELLEFYRITLVLLMKKSSGVDFDINWPSHEKNIDIVVNNLRRYSKLTTTEENLVGIDKAREARNQSYNHFAHEAQLTRQKYLALQARVSPELYDRRLGFLRDRCVPKCAEWLLRHETFTNWLDVRNTTLPSLWLQGIPGAGKTYLTATVIDHVRERHRTLFALVTHMNTTSLTALSVIQSLLFQAAEDDRELQLILVETKERELHGNTKYVAGLLKNFLLTAGAYYIIIDGLDEMEEVERGILLTNLAEVSKDCVYLRLLICSRAEDDISERLERKTSIRVNEKNHGSIQIYIDHRTRRLLARRQFDLDTQSELFSLISPLSAKANGMFLYARIILDNLEQMSSIDEMRNELEALPNDLKEAYGRIFHRINTASRGSRDRCRRILGWMGCATAPMTIFEMEHALAVDADPEKDLHEPPRPLEKFNFVKNCGPIIEEVDEKLQFVHFTVKEYIFSTEIVDYIGRADAMDDLCMTLLAYLGSGVLDVELDDEEITDNIVGGKYRLLEYAVFYWPKLIYEMDSERRDYGKLLERLIEKGANFEFESPETAKRLYRNEHLRKTIPDAYDMVCKTFQMRSDDRRWDWEWHNSDKWVNFDPLNTSQMLVRIQREFERLVNSPERVASVQRHYGSGLFRCTHVFCWWNLRGSQTQKDRDAHITTHGRPWKCTIPDCDPFATIGFSSKSKREDHWLKCHLHPTSQIGAALDNFETLDTAEAQPILFRLVLEDRIDNVRTLLAAPGGKKLKAEVLVSARNLAIHKGSLEMTEALAPKDEKQVPQNILASAVKREDIHFAKWAISQAGKEDWTKLMKVLLSVKSDEIYAVWEEHILTLPQLVPQLVGTTNPLARAVLERLFRQSIFTDIKDNIKKEERVKHTLEELKEKLEWELKGEILLRIARSSCSIPLTGTLLSLGVDINYSSDRGRKMTPLRIASTKTTREAALFMRYLLANGANPRYRGYDIGEERGAKEIIQWVGSTWEELVAQTGHLGAGSSI